MIDLKRYNASLETAKYDAIETFRDFFIRIHSIEKDFRNNNDFKTSYVLVNTIFNEIEKVRDLFDLCGQLKCSIDDKNRLK